MAPFGSVIAQTVAGEVAPGKDWVVDAVLVLLVFLSIGVWAIGFWRWRVIKSVSSGDEAFRQFFWQQTDFRDIRSRAEEDMDLPFAVLFRVADRTQRMLAKTHTQADSSERAEALQRSLQAETNKIMLGLETGAGFLATTASAAPFIGLFGTVWGILQSFKAIGIMQSVSLATVAPGLSEALIATAVGLVAAIPAVVANNILAGKLDYVRAQCEVFNAELVNACSVVVER